MLGTLARIFGLDRTPKPTPIPPRPPSARIKKPVQPPAPARAPEAPKTHRIAIAERPARTPSATEAVRIFAASVGRIPGNPRPAVVDAAREVLGEDAWSYLRALHLTDGQLTAFYYSEERDGDPAADAGIREKLESRLMLDLDTWRELTRTELKTRAAARHAGRPVPDMVPIPQRVELALAADLARRAARNNRGGRGAVGGTATDGGVVATPETTTGGAEGASDKVQGTPEGAGEPADDGGAPKL